MFKFRMQREVAGSLFWFAVGIFFALIAANMILGTFRKPGPGFLPLGMALLLIFCSLIELLYGLRGPIKPIGVILWKRPAFVLVSVFFYSYLLELIGFLFSTFFLMVVLFALLMSPKKHKWSSVIFCSAISALVAWLVFKILLRIPFPVPLIGVGV